MAIAVQVGLEWSLSLSLYIIYIIYINIFEHVYIEYICIYIYIMSGPD